MNMLWAGTQDSLELFMKQESEPRPTVEDCGVDMKAYADSLEPFGEDSEEDLPVSPLLTVTGGVGIITIAGLLVTEDSWYNAFMGRTSYGDVQRAAMVAAARSDVDTILLDITSPGGNVIGARETMLILKAVGKEKPLVGFAEMAASSAYWLMSVAGERYISATGIGGSIGVVAHHVEYSKAQEKAGIKETVLRAGQYKQLMNSAEPLTDAAVVETMRLLDESYRVFVQDIATNLNAPFAQIDAVAQGREYLGQQAVDVGLFNKVSDFQGVLSALVVTEEEGGSIVSKNKSLTYSMASAFAASAAGREVTGTPAVDAEGNPIVEADVEPKLDAEGNPIVEAESDVEPKLDAEGNPIVEADAEPTKEEQLELDLQASVALVAERDVTIAAAIDEAEEAKVKLDLAQATINDLSAIVAKAVGNISIALNIENALADDADAATILAAYTEKSELFEKQFPAGGVAAVDAATEEPAKEVSQSRMDAARSKQTVAPRVGR